MESARGSVGGFHALLSRSQWLWVVYGFAAALLAGAGVGRALEATGVWDRGLAWEHALLAELPRDVPPLVDALFLTLPWLGTSITLMPAVLTAAVWLARRGRRDLALHLAVVQVGSWLLNLLLKWLFDRARPDLWEKRGQFAFDSYPSGHAIATIAVLITVALLLRRERGWRWPFVLAGLLGAVSLYSRLYLGVHWPSDVIAGALVGSVWLWATVRAFAPAAARAPAVAPQRLADDRGTYLG